MTSQPTPLSSPTSGHEDFPDSVVFELFDVGDAYKSQSGLEFVLLRAETDKKFSGAFANTGGYPNSLNLRTDIKINLAKGSARKIEFFYRCSTTGSDFIAATITFYASNGEQIATRPMESFSYNFFLFEFEAPPELDISYFEIRESLNLVYFQIKGIAWRS